MLNKRPNCKYNDDKVRPMSRLVQSKEFKDYERLRLQKKYDAMKVLRQGFVNGVDSKSKNGLNGKLNKRISDRNIRKQGN